MTLKRCESTVIAAVSVQTFVEKNRVEINRWFSDIQVRERKEQYEPEVRTRIDSAGDQTKDA